MYDDIINLERPVSINKNKMSIHDRSAQFSSFAALNGYEEAIEETSRLTNEKIELDDNEIEIINNKIRFLLENINNDINVEITYYEPDSKKKGGHYIKHNGIIKKIIEYDKTIIFKDGKSIFIGNIIDLKY